MAKILCVLYPDPVSGHPYTYARDSLPELECYPDGQSLPSPEQIDFKPGELLGSVSGKLGLEKYLQANGHEYVVTDDKEGLDSQFEKELADAEIVISQPFWPAYLTAERFAKAKKLKLAITAGIGSDHVDLQAALKHNVTVAEVTYSNSISVAEHNVMMVLSLVRNYLPSHQWIVNKGWNIADCALRSYDLEGMIIGIVGAGRIGKATMCRLHGFTVKMRYTDQHRLPSTMEQELGLIYHSNLEEMLPNCDVVIICCPLHAKTEHMFNEKLLSKLKRGTYLINTARAKICDRDAIVNALRTGQLAGYAGDVWYPQPAPADHPWRTMPHHGMTPHIAGTTLSAQTRYAAGVREILECWFSGKPIRDEYLIVRAGSLAGAGAHAYTV